MTTRGNYYYMADGLAGVVANPVSRRKNLASSVEAPMVGKVLKIEKQVGDAVEEDDVVIVMEAMKMEIPVVAPSSGKVKEIKVSAGQAVEAGDILAEIE